MGHGRPLEPPDNNSTRNPEFPTRSMWVAETSPSVPRRDGEGTYELVREPAPIASNGPRIRGSTHGYTSWGAPNADNAKYACVASPRPTKISPIPVETNTPRTGRFCEKTLQEHHAPARLRGLDPRVASAAPRNSTGYQGEERPISKRQHLQDPNGYTHKCSGAIVGDSHKGPLNNQGKPAYLHKK
jgi:hypothetical protein